MEKNQNIYKPIDLAHIYGVHPNTIRLYERLRYISPAERNENGYRIFTDLHILQVKVCRCIFGYPFTNRCIRNAGNEVMWASGKEQWISGMKCAQTYLEVVTHEYNLAKKTATALQNWIKPEKSYLSQAKEGYISRKDVADMLGITIEAVRNWERNDLISSCATGEYGEILYKETDLDRLNVIYMLRQAGYSIVAIHHSISMYDKGQIDMVLPALHEPEPNELISVGDRWQHELSKLLCAAKKIPPIFEEMAAL